MITLTAGEIGLLVGGEMHCDKDLLVSKAPVFDSRKATPGCIFLALQGEVVDGHDYAADAYRAGAMFSLTTKRIDGPCIVVEDVIEALIDLGYLCSQTVDQLNCYRNYWLARKDKHQRSDVSYVVCGWSNRFASWLI
jgi:UDP-N-acetylmuramoyl-tripeptide--D-alanyl-D-alanine ligase